VGVVYRAHDTESCRYVALKLIAHRGNDDGDELRFEREGQVLSGLDHPNIVRVVAFGTLPDRTPFIAMEWLDGEDLCARQRRAPLAVGEAVEVAKQVALALEAAHQRGIVHRDVKPTNLFLLSGEGPLRVKLVDFGVAAAGDIKLTRSGGIVGTPAYMAPEQARGDGPVDARADLYALGATLFELLAGRPPHVGPTPIATLARLVTTPAPRVSDFVPEVAPALDELVSCLLATAPEDRPQSAGVVASRLAALQRDPAQLRGVIAEMEAPVPSLASGSRLVTTLVVLSAGEGAVREAAMAMLRGREADAVPLGKDGIVAHLGARQALGDEAGRALDLALDLAKSGGRVGIATGRTQVRMSRPVGELVDRAAAFAREAQGGQVVADATTTELTRGRFEILHRGGGSALVKGQLQVRRTEVNGGAPFVGREAELAQILNAYERCTEDRCPIVVTCAGPPGIGKTRLRREVLTRIVTSMTTPHLVVVRCESFGRSQALGAAAEVLRGLLGLSKGVSAVAAARVLDLRLDDTVRGVHDPGREQVARLLANEPLDGKQSGQDALWLAMTDLILRACAQEPVAIALEDVQWADPESVRWLDHILARAQGRALWVLALARPSFWKEQPRAFAGRDHVRIELRPISRKAARSIAQAMLGDRVPEEALERIAAQAAGSPLFAEELARLAAAGRDASKAPTIEAAIQTSIDALDEPLRDAVRRMSVFGQAAWQPGLGALGVPDPGGVLRQLAAVEFVVEHADSRFARVSEWSFKHALVREVAYASIDPAARATLHEQVAVWLEAMGEDAAVVARHYELGNQHQKAGVHWEHAARRALATSALQDALSMAERAFSFAEGRVESFSRALLLDEAYARLDPRSSERETAIRALAESTYDEASEIQAEVARARYDDARGAGEHIAERLLQVRQRAARLQLQEEEVKASAALAARLAFAGRLPEAEAEAAHLLALAERRGLDGAAVEAWQTLAIVRQTRGELLSALEARRNAARAASSGGLKVREATLTINVGFALTTIGARQEARAAIEQGLSLAQSIGSAGVQQLGRMVLLGWSATFGTDRSVDGQLAEPRAEADAAAAGGWMLPDRLTLGVLFYRGVELLRAGDEAEAGRARALLKRAAEAYRSTGMRDVLPVALGEWAEAERRCGDAGLAVELALEAVGLLEGGAPSLLNEGPVYLALHDAQMDRGQHRAARDAIGRAMPPLLRRLQGLVGSSYALAFLTQLPANASLLANAEAYGLLPREIEGLLERAALLGRRERDDGRGGQGAPDRAEVHRQGACGGARGGALGGVLVGDRRSVPHEEALRADGGAAGEGARGHPEEAQGGAGVADEGADGPGALGAGAQAGGPQAAAGRGYQAGGRVPGPRRGGVALTPSRRAARGRCGLRRGRRPPGGHAWPSRSPCAGRPGGS
jgi:tetratricopeptide (TPR) repeat protein